MIAYISAFTSSLISAIKSGLSAIKFKEKKNIIKFNKQNNAKPKRFFIVINDFRFILSSYCQGFDTELLTKCQFYSTIKTSSTS